MNLTPEQIEELELLEKFDPANTQAGIKVHTSAGTPAIAAAQRMHNKGLITQPDGGYLTARGAEAAELVQALQLIMTKD